ncbi:MAG: hypothetical protein ACKOAH_07875 [Pirellula sp.]
MVDLNRRLQAHQQIVPYRFLVAIAFLASLHTAIFQTAGLGLAQEPRKPSWMPFPMGRASNNFTPANPTPTSPAPPAQAGGNVAQPNTTQPNTTQSDPSRPQPWLMWSDPLAPNSQQPGDCYFRRTMELPEVERCFVDIDCQTKTDVYFNGQRVRPTKPGTGKQRIELQSAVRPGLK